MKKIFTLALAAAMACGTASAQTAFKHLGMSIEAGTTGLGVNLSYPLVTNHLVLTLGYNFPSFSIHETAELKRDYVNNKVAHVNEMIDRFNNGVNTYNNKVSQLNSVPNLGLNLETLSPIANHVAPIEDMTGDIEAKINFGNFKVMLEYYPTIKSYFHLTAGVFIGNGDWMTISGTVDRNSWSTYLDCLKASDGAIATVRDFNNRMLGENNKKIDAANEKIEAYNNIPGVAKQQKLPHMSAISESEPVDDAAAVTINGHTYVLDKNSDGVLNVALAVKKVKPYLGIGFGSSVPTKHRCGFQMELGAYFQGTPELVSTQENNNFLGSTYKDKTIDNVVETICHFEWYPQMTFRWTGRLF